MFLSFLYQFRCSLLLLHSFSFSSLSFPFLFSRHFPLALKWTKPLNCSPFRKKCPSHLSFSFLYSRRCILSPFCFACSLCIQAPVSIGENCVLYNEKSQGLFFSGAVLLGQNLSSAYVWVLKKFWSWAWMRAYSFLKGLGWFYAGHVARWLQVHHTVYTWMPWQKN